MDPKVRADVPDSTHTHRERENNKNNPDTHLIKKSSEQNYLFYAFI